MMHLLIDDVKEGGWADIVARNGRAGVLILEQLFPHISHLYIDHDLGTGMNGYEVVKWALANGFLPNRVQIVSMNPVGRERIKNILLDHGYKDNVSAMGGSWYIKES